MSVLFSPMTLRGVRLPNRITLSPMCQYSAIDGMPNEWHLMHLGARAAGGVGLIITEAAAVAAEGRISPLDVGLWSDEQVDAWRPITGFITARGSVPGVQLAHAGFKASTYHPWALHSGGVPDAEGGWQPVGPGDRPFAPGYRSPVALDGAGIDAVVAAFAAAARRAVDAGFRVVEVHGAHGYLLHEFLSPLTNDRTDGYGGDRAGRSRLMIEVVRAVRVAVGETVAVLVRISATDWVPGGWSIDDSVELAKDLAAEGVDLIDVSSGGAVATADIPVGPGYQVPLAERIRLATGVPTGAVGMITEPAQAEEIIAAGRAALVLLGRQLLRDPHWALRAAAEFGVDARWPTQYLRAR
jgi:2,4-dienoyl-CoA reductase-like NADH-dependent reductase (Old Yellow Enzyme family)